MKTTDEIRYRNLEKLVEQAGDLTRLVEKSNGKLSRPTLDQILKKRTTAAGVVKNVGDDLARKIEEVLRLERGWMDNDHDEDRNNSDNKISPAELADLVLIFCQTDDIGRRGIRAAIEAARLTAITTGNDLQAGLSLPFRGKV